ncbi:MAG: MFS transporter [Candidatus Parvarchaeota archaeon]
MKEAICIDLNMNALGTDHTSESAEYPVPKQTKTVQSVESGKKSDEDAETFDRGYANRTLVLLSLIVALIMYIDTMLTPALPKIETEYRVSPAQASMLISLYIVFGAAVIPFVGKVGDIYGKKRLLMYILVFYIIAATATSILPDFNLILVSRFVQGIGLGAIPLALSLAREQFPRSLVPRSQGVITAIQVTGAALGLIGGAVITNNFEWEGNYYIALPFILILTLIIFFTVRESKYRKTGVKLDYVGAVLLGAALTSIVLGLSEGTNWGWSSAPILGLLIGGTVMMFPLALYERRLSEPVLDLGLLGQRNVMIANLIFVAFGLVSGIAFLALVYAFELPAPSGFGVSIIEAGIYLLPLIVIIPIVAITVGKFVPKYGVKPFLYLSFIFVTTAFLMLSTYTSTEQIELYLLVYAVGGGLMSVSLQSFLVFSISKSEMALGISLTTSFRYIGQTLGTAVAGIFLSVFVGTYSVSSHVLTLPTRAGIHYLFFISAILFIVMGVLSIFAREVIKIGE